LIVSWKNIINSKRILQFLFFPPHIWQKVESFRDNKENSDLTIDSILWTLSCNVYLLHLTSRSSNFAYDCRIFICWVTDRRKIFTVDAINDSQLFYSFCFPRQIGREQIKDHLKIFYIGGGWQTSLNIHF